MAPSALPPFAPVDHEAALLAAAMSSQWAHWAALAQEARLQQHAGLIRAGPSGKDLEPRKVPVGGDALEPRKVPVSLRLDGLLPEEGLSGCAVTPSTSAASSPRRPRSVSPPPGLPLLPPSAPVGFRPPPGLPPPEASAVPSAAQAAPLPAPAESVEWCLRHVYGKLKASAGFALVSAPMQVGPVADVRLHFVPGEAWAASTRKKNKRGDPKAEEAQLGALRLKVGDVAPGKKVRFLLHLGDIPQGPFECSFDERAVQECRFDVDWRELLEEGDSLALRLEVLDQQ